MQDRNSVNARNKGSSFSLFLELEVNESVCQGEKLELCYDPARDRRVIAQVRDARDIREREADYLPSPRVDGRDERGSRVRTMGRRCRMRINSSLGLES